MSVGSAALGHAGAGTARIGAAGTVAIDGRGLAAGVAALTVGSFANATGVVTVSGSQALLDAGTRDIRLGAASGGDGSLAVSLGGQVRAGTIVVGDTGIGSFAADIGGASAAAMDVGAKAGSQGTVFVTHRNTGLGLNALTVGDHGLGRVAVTDNAILVVHGTVVMGNTVGATGQVAVAGGAHFHAQGLIDGAGGDGALTVGSGAEITINNGLTVGATGALSLQAGNVTAARIVNQSGIAGAGVITAPALVNNGVITAAGGTLTIDGAVSGTGVLAVAANSELAVGAVGAGQAFAFTAPTGTLQLGSLAATSAGVIAGFGAGDQIQVVTGGSIATSFDAGTDALTITAGAAARTFQVTGSHTAADFASAVVGVDTVLAANQTIDLGAGPHLLYLGAASTHDTIAAPTLPTQSSANFLDIFNFASTDTLDFTAALAGTDWNGSAGTVGNYLSVATSANSAVIALSATSGGAGVGIVKLDNSGAMTLAQVLAHATI